jgi:hypothetical protein
LPEPIPQQQYLQEQQRQPYPQPQQGPPLNPIGPLPQPQPLPQGQVMDGTQPQRYYTRQVR